MNTNLERTSTLKLALISFGLISALSVMSARADTITAVSNLGFGDGGGGGVVGSGNGFTTGSGPGWYLENLGVRLFTDVEGSHDVTMSLLQGSTTLGQSTRSVTATATTIYTPTVYEFSFSTPILLAPNTTYTLWSNGDRDTYWSYVFSDAESGPVGWSIEDKTYQGLAAYQFEVNVTPVPLPAAAWLFGSALFGVAGLGYRNRRKSAV